MTVKEIVEEWLKKNGYDGLFYNGECDCEIGDLAPCDGECMTCEAGYKHPGDEEYNWYIRPNKPEVKNGRNGETDKED